MKRDRIAELEAWLAREAPTEPFDRTVAAGMFALAGLSPVRAAHVEQAIEYARSAGMTNLVEMHAIGALVLRYEAANGAPVEAPPPLPRTRTADNDGFAMLDLAEEPASDAPLTEAMRNNLAVELDALPDDAPPLEVEPTPVAPASEPALPTITLKTPVVTTSELPAAELAPVEPPAPPAAKAPVPKATSRTGLVLAVAVLVGGGAFAMLRGTPAPVAKPITKTAVQPPEKAPAVPLVHPVHLGDVDLRTPAGWSSSPELIYRGDEAAPDESMTIVTAPLPPDLAAPTATDEALLAATRIAARGIGGQIARDGGHFELGSCGIMSGQHTGSCRGIAQTASGPIAIDSYLRVVNGKAIVAIVSAKKPRPGARREAVDMLASATTR